MIIMISLYLNDIKIFLFSKINYNIIRNREKIVLHENTIPLKKIKSIKKILLTK